MTLHGPDLSHHQGSVDMSALRRGGADFVILKATQGTTMVDATFAPRLAAARAAGLLVGAYHFAGGGNPVAEADYFLAHVDHRAGEVLVLDWEIAHADPDSWVAAFVQRVKDSVGVPPMVYMNSSTARSISWAKTRATNAGLWVAQYGTNTGVKQSPPSVGAWGSFAEWQYSSRGGFSGVIGQIDVNEFYGDAAAWQRYGGLNAASSPPVAPAPAPAPTPPAPAPAAGRTYVVASGDTLSGIAARFGTTYQELARINGIANPNVILAGQVLRLDGAAPAPAPAPAAPAPALTVVVAKGDTLSAIATRHGTTWQTLQRLNDIKDASKIYPGQVIRLP